MRGHGRRGSFAPPVSALRLDKDNMMEGALGKLMRLRDKFNHEDSDFSRRLALVGGEEEIRAVRSSIKQSLDDLNWALLSNADNNDLLRRPGVSDMVKRPLVALLDEQSEAMMSSIKQSIADVRETILDVNGNEDNNRSQRRRLGVIEAESGLAEVVIQNSLSQMRKALELNRDNEDGSLALSDEERAEVGTIISEATAIITEAFKTFDATLRSAVADFKAAGTGGDYQSLQLLTITTALIGLVGLFVGFGIGLAAYGLMLLTVQIRSDDDDDD